jgi:hypothetical protein
MLNVSTFVFTADLMIYTKYQFEQPDTKPCIHSGVIYAKYKAYLDRQNKSKDGNNFESIENKLTNKTPNRFADFKLPLKTSCNHPHSFFISPWFCLHGVFHLKTIQIED